MSPESPPADGPDHYTLLGVDRVADAEALRKAYRTQAKLVHPDSFPFDSVERIV
ncbi:MAG: J domain-containing protein, partial [Candidatus Sericytochromatia bacterium]|nr:J domain-containing protein [Candidatus Sericytochromatia bacterium]